ncbi:SET domain-containing protein [Tothia fuscella]|uniref:SET domain-containing protein n=1 Tax=Tothia fuscella TaxID=1048955 RepID=A0A9P4NRL6_9PEZI|nr:SET domain-containing protein [Tothia fuscella]
MLPISNGLPKSPLFQIKQTPTAGRAVFATQFLKSGTHLLTTSTIPASILLRPYKREVCAQCFHYNRGRNLPHKSIETGHYFCTLKCSNLWHDEAGEIGIAAWVKVETFVKAKKRPTFHNGEAYENLPDADAPFPTEEDIERSWGEVEGTAHFIRQARAGSTKKPHRRAVAAVLNVHPNADLLCFQLDGTLARAKDAPVGWDSLMELVPDSTPYKRVQELKDHVLSYLHLLCLLPLPLLDLVTPELCLGLTQRDSHNSFGIRSLDDGGDEFFGYGVWPEASFFNHSCRPNVGKRREGRSWVFWVEGDVDVGKELCISYLGGDEAEMSLVERRVMTVGTWGFECGCGTCVEDVMREKGKVLGDTNGVGDLNGFEMVASNGTNGVGNGVHGLNGHG